MQCGHGFDLFFAAQHAALGLEVVETIALMRGFGLANDGLGGQRGFVADARPGIVGIGLAVVSQTGLAAVADKKQVTEHFDRIALLAFAQQGRHRNAQVLAEQVEQRRLDGGHGMDGASQIEGLQAAPAAVAAFKALLHLLQHAEVTADGPANEKRTRIFERLADLFTAGNFAHAGASGVVGQDQQVAGEKRPVRAAQVEQHTVAAGNGNDAPFGDHWRAGFDWRDGLTDGFRFLRIH